MGYTIVALKNRIREIYPEIEEHGLTFGLGLSDDDDAYVVKLKKEPHELITFLEKKDADACMDGMKCVPLGVKIGEFIKNFET
ncbi:MAG: hypothetical protein AB1499_16265 [Nitrospirota bacterium]